MHEIKCRVKHSNQVDLDSGQEIIFQCKSCNFKLRKILKARKEIEFVGMLMAEYINCKKIKVICNCNFEYITALSSINLGQKCAQCGTNTRILKNNYKYSEEKMKEIELEIKAKGMSLISYLRADYVIVKCICDNEYTTTMFHIKNGIKCKKCWSDVRRENRNFKNNEEKITKIKSDIEKLGMKLIEYKSSRNIIVLCICGEEYHCDSTAIKRGYRCKKCGYEKQKDTNFERYGVNNPMQNSEIFSRNQKNSI